MVKVPDRVKLIIDKYISLLIENKIQIEKVMLFGSYAKGTFHEFSDIDLAVVSDFFEGIRIKDTGKIRHITLAVSSDLEIFPYNSKEFKSDNPFVNEILETGIQIY